MKKIVLFLTMTVLVLGCGPLLPDGVPTCEEAFTNFYDKGCAFIDGDGEAMSLGDIVADCEQYISALVRMEGDNEACLLYTTDTLFCFDRVKKVGQCDTCHDELRMMAGCLPELDESHSSIDTDREVNRFGG